ncbi:hypothetical protein C8R47DRAFT_442933 [Mycena vitilis]|nr:hypothetical protein C8R47DRAFT_442933 [Mycena vitilis]
MGLCSCAVPCLRTPWRISFQSFSRAWDGVRPHRFFSAPLHTPPHFSPRYFLRGCPTDTDTVLGSCVRYFGIFLLNAGSSGCIPSILAYSANNVVGSSKRSVASALTVAFGGVGGIIASTVYREQDFPRYLPGLWVTLGAQFVLLFLVGVTSLHFVRMNRLARAGKLAGPLEGQPGFFYTL